MTQRWARPGSVIGAVPLAERVAHLLALGAFVLVAYLPGLDAPFVFDDIRNIVANPTVHPDTFADLVAVLGSPVSADRPLALASFALNYLWGGLDPTGYRQVNIAIHLLNGWLVYLLAGLLLGIQGRPAGLAGRIAFCAALVWVVHPVHTQSVTYVVQRMTSLATLFYLLALATWTAHRLGSLGRRPALIAIGVSFVLAMAAKPIAVTLPVALVALDRMVLTPRAERGRHHPWLVPAGALAGMALVGIAFMKGRLPDWTVPLPGRDFSAIERMLTEPRVLWDYLSVLAFPHPSRLQLDYDVVVSRGLLDPPSTLVAIVATVVVIGLAWRLRRGFAVASFAVVFFFLASSVEASFVNIELAFIHRTYLPSALLVLGLLSMLPASALERIAPAAVVLAAVLAHGTAGRNAEWTSGAELWARDAERGASVGRAQFSRAIELSALGRSAEAIETMEGELDLAEVAATPLALFELARAHLFAGNLERAEDLFALHDSRFGASHAVRFHRGEIRLRAGRPDEAAAFAAAIEAVAPGHPYAAVLEARHESAGGRLDAAAARLESAIDSARPGEITSLNLPRLHLAEIELMRGDHARAHALYQAVVRDEPDNYPAWLRIHRMQIAGGDLENAARIARFLRSRGVRVDAGPAAD